MDLAKIRKKSLQAPVKPVDELFVAPPASLKCKGADQATPASAAVVMDTFLPLGSHFSGPEASRPAVPLAPPVMFPDQPAVERTPLEAILAGRSAAGCDDESILAEDATCQVVAETSVEFLCFRVSDEIYGINIMDIKEIIKPREVTEVPRAPVFVSGVLSLRGIIIPIIDMRIRLGLAGENLTGKERIVVIKNSDSFSGLLVDEVIQVVKVPFDAIEAAPAILDGIDRDFVSGVGRSEGRLIIILNLENIADINLY